MNFWILVSIWTIAICGYYAESITNHRLIVPETHTALAGNLKISLHCTDFHLPLLLTVVTNRYFDSISGLQGTDQNTLISIHSNFTDTKIAICSDRMKCARNATFEISCSCFDQAGEYVIEVYDSSATLLASGKVTVSWPSIILQLPNSGSIMTDPVPLRISIPANLRRCSPFDHYNRSMGPQIIDLPDRLFGNWSDHLLNNRSDFGQNIYFARNYSTLVLIRRFETQNATGLFKETMLPVKNWWALINSTIQLSCLLFIHPGTYEVSLLTQIKIFQSVRSITISDHPKIEDQSINRNHGKIDSGSISIAKTKLLIPPVNFSDGYDLKVIGHYIYPCPPDKGVPISYHRPITSQCHRSLKYDAIRLFAAQAQQLPDSRLKHKELFIDLKHNYVAEEKLPTSFETDASKHTSAGVAYFGCNNFDLIYPEYCFQFVSIYEDGTVLERGRHCIPTQVTKYTPINGQWSTWQSWSACTVACGYSSVQHRLRYCSQPAPSDGGQFCAGHGLETKSCSVQKCPNAPSSTPAPANQSIPYPLTSSEDKCSCGCNFTKPEGGVIAIDASLCAGNVTSWFIFAPMPCQIIELKILRIRFRHSDIDWLRIRDNFDLSSSGDLLYDSTGDTNSIDHSHMIIKSRSDRLLIQHFSSSKIDRSQSSILQKIEGSDVIWYGVLIRYRFISSIDQRPIDSDRGLRYWWTLVKSDKKWLSIFVITISFIGLVFLGSIYFFAAVYTRRKLRSKCHYLMLLSQTTQTSTVPGQSIGPTASPQSANRSSICEIVNIRKPVSRSEFSTKEPLLSRIGHRSDFEIDTQRKSILKSKHQIPAPNLAQIPEECMQTSINTETTRLSGLTQSPSPVSPPRPQNSTLSKSTPKSVRSIGIQLSSPALSGIRRHVSSDRCHPATNGNGQKLPVSTSSMAGASANRPESPNFSFAGTEQDDFEYDYYDAPVPGSFFNYQHSHLGGWRSSYFETNIHIDDIIDQSDLMKSIDNNNSVSSHSNGHEQPPSPAATMVSVSTQSHPVLAAGDSAESSEWSFKWTKPSTATTQFHFL